MAERVPQKTVEVNLAALRAGRAVIENEEENSMTVSQISVFRQQPPGHMNRVLDLFEGAGVSVRGFSAADTGSTAFSASSSIGPEAAMEAL